MKGKATTKERILLIIKKENECTIKDIVAHFTISEIAIRRHLRELMSRGFVDERSVKQEIGRPFHKYKLTPLGHGTFPNQDDALPLEILSDIESTFGKEAVSTVLKQRKNRESHAYKLKTLDENFDEQIKRVAEIQDSEGYMAEYKKKEDGSYEIINYNCPVYGIASSFTEVCDNEKKVLQKTFPHSEVVSHSRITDGEKNCCWTISKPIKTR